MVPAVGTKLSGAGVGVGLGASVGIALAVGVGIGVGVGALLLELDELHAAAVSIKRATIPSFAAMTLLRDR